jgi:cellulose synthase/poly-beta-1,6-N-acetylglucosamine synthase-like glycosyltransferase
MKLFYWLTLLLLLHTWGGYLIFLMVLSRLKPGKFVKKDIYPRVTVLLTVHNEERLIKARITNLLDADYPAHLLEILVASDGSTDRTDDIVELLRKEDGRIKLFKTNGGGKSATQNKAIPFAEGEIIVLTDAEAAFERDTITTLVNNFADGAVGCVSGRVILKRKDESIASSQGIYWKYETLLRRLESRCGLLLNASGQIMAFRTNLFRPFECRYGDDCMIPLDMVLQGYKVVHEDRAVAYDTFPSTIKAELKARQRMTLRNITGRMSKYKLLNPCRFPLASFSILSHKLLRWLTPYFMISLLFFNLCLAKGGHFYVFTLCCQIMFYFLGVIGFIAAKHNHRLPIASPAFSFILANIGFFLGILYAVLGQKITAYKN